MKYASLLHHTRTSHAELSDVLGGHTAPSAVVSTILFIRQLLTTTLHPRFLFFIPPLLVHLPAFAFAKVGLRLLYKSGEEETKSQIQVVTGGFALATVYTLLGVKLSRAISNAHVEVFGLPKVEAVLKLITHTLLMNSGNQNLDKVKRTFGTIAVICLLGFTFNKWHKALITCKHRIPPRH